MLLYGDPKVGKSFAALQLAVSLATGTDWLSFQISAPRRVVYIQLDTPRSLWADRVGSLAATGLATSAVWFADRETLGTWPFDILDPAHLSMLSSSLALLQPDCVILDTLREAHRGDENDATDMQNVLSHLTAAVKPAALVLVAHGRKADPERGASLINDNRGSNYVVGAVDAIAHMSKKSLSVGGRAVEEQTIRIERQDNGTWDLADRDRVKVIAREILEDPRNVHLSLREKAATLHNQTGKSFAAALSLLQRMSRENLDT
jgi:RecA-family ATPase